MKNHICKKKCQSSYAKKSLSWLPALFIAIIPKCPFCIMAYSGAMTLCTGTTMYPNADTSTSYISLGLALFVLFSIFFNNKGEKTKYALCFTMTGLFLLMGSQFYWISEYLYYLGVGFIFFGIWYNGSFGYFYQKVTTLFKRTTIKFVE